MTTSTPQTLPDQDSLIEQAIEKATGKHRVLDAYDYEDVFACCKAALASQPPADPLKPLTELSEELGMHSVQPPTVAPKSFEKLYEDNAQGVEIERLNMRIEELQAQVVAAIPEGWTKERGYHALVQVIYELQNDGSYSDDEGEETHALVALVLRMEQADACAPRPPAGQHHVPDGTKLVQGGQQDRGEALIEAIEEFDGQLKNWASAYPLEVFPEPDLKKVHALLQAEGMTLDAVSASNMRHVTSKLSELFQPVRAAVSRATATAGEATAAQGADWLPIETAPENERLIVFYLQKEGDEVEEFYTFDIKEDGGWVHHDDQYEHYRMVAGGGEGWTGPSEKAPYTHWKRLGAPSPAAPGNGEGGK